MTLFKNRVLVDAVTMRSPRSGLSSNDWCPCEKSGRAGRNSQRTPSDEDGDRDGVRQLQADKRQGIGDGHRKCQKRQGRILPHRFQREKPTPSDLDFRSLASRSVTEYISVVLSHSATKSVVFCFRSLRKRTQGAKNNKKKKIVTLKC